MEFMNWYIDVLKNKYAKFDGRAGRPEYWFFVLGNIVVAIALVILGQIPVIGMLFSIVLVLYWLAILVPAVAITARRLHDIGRSGWMQLLSLIPFVGPIIVLVFTVLPSAEGSNSFGPPAPTSPGK